VTNAATLYRQAFALYGALSKDEKGILVDWRTNVDASVEAELCEKMRPICDLMHKATAVTNCDWGIEPLTYDSKLPHLNPARAVSRATIWNAAHCRANDAPSASEDVLSTLRLGKSVSSSALIGSLVDVAIQGIAESYLAANIGLFRVAEGKRLSASLSDLIYVGEPSLAMEQEASMVERFVPKLASMPPEELEKNISQLLDGQNASEMDRAALLVGFQQIVDSQRALAKVLASGSTDEYEAWQQSSAELQNSNPLAKGFLAAYERVVDKWDRAAINRAFVEAALAVAEEGASALQSHPDPSNGQPFVYTETSDGFQLQSGYKTNGVTLTMQFK
jgi:cell division septation protein DedD